MKLKCLVVIYLVLMCTSIVLSPCPIKITVNGKEVCMQQDGNSKTIVPQGGIHIGGATITSSKIFLIQSRIFPGIRLID